ncbi:hypothetical protein EVAR_83298_1 [Eumeta japonica]|uniref:Uncharacterized protein n=1 Tax=Eumeta variegata TaxID=151549 RepID=A0A4C2A5C2_EUMVA|nr:hypothetical protein EVAR_83298_1 [Eumeta japonica]
MKEVLKVEEFMLTALLVQQLNCKCTIRSVSFRCSATLCGVLVAVCAACWRRAPRKLDLQPPAAGPAIYTVSADQALQQGRREASSSAEVPLPARDCRSGSGRLDRGVNRALLDKPLTCTHYTAYFNHGCPLQHPRMADGGAIPEIATPLEILKGYRGAGGPVGARPRRDNVTRRRRTRSKSRTNVLT